ncbi:MAG: hypothetical protein HN580_25115 [Deltaproteobacteria bacterium]|jgi:hypothetical protein|nr:hypothetical protein [Deltaproteobacteria bacterium]MBT4640319.1 hypothetical protein [Deltaproteobacteria bacterium]MBT6503719.1 hypothetical protein [Deltaproteobacteria bacterium]MBT6614439.1 hypothetical protein [Deltaproteobacteria bacterium]MBT7152829.1 hypothetical protein [Deltaproteobacteria bacterium]
MIKSINNLLPNEQKWLAKTVASIILADTSFKESQTDFIKNLFKTFLDEEPLEFLSELFALIKRGINPKFEKIEITNPDKLIFILDILSATVFVNGKRLHLETERFFEAGKKLGFRMGMLSYRLSLEVEKERVKRKLDFISNDIRKEFK